MGCSEVTESRWHDTQPFQISTELVSPGPALWEMQGEVRRRAERVSRPAREKKRRLRTLVVAHPSPDRGMRSSVPSCGR